MLAALYISTCGIIKSLLRLSWHLEWVKWSVKALIQNKDQPGLYVRMTGERLLDIKLGSFFTHKISFFGDPEIQNSNSSKGITSEDFEYWFHNSLQCEYYNNPYCHSCSVGDSETCNF